MRESIISKWIIKGFGIVYPYVLFVLVILGLFSITHTKVMSENQFVGLPAPTEVKSDLSVVKGSVVDGIQNPNQIPVKLAIQKLVNEAKRSIP